MPPQRLLRHREHLRKLLLDSQGTPHLLLVPREHGDVSLLAGLLARLDFVADLLDGRREVLELIGERWRDPRRC